MKCNNFLCAMHDTTYPNNCYCNAEGLERNCETRKRYNRIVRAGSKQWSARCDIGEAFEEERFKYRKGECWCTKHKVNMTHGTAGQIIWAESCPSCNGTGKVIRDATVQDVCDALLTYDKECSKPIWKLKSGETLKLRSSYED